MTGPTPQSRSTGSAWRNVSSSPIGTTSKPSGFADRARDLRQELRPRDAHGDGDPDLLAHRLAQSGARSPTGCRRSAGVRRRRGTPRRSRALRRAASCPGRPRTSPCSPRSTPPSADARRWPGGRGGEPASRPSVSARRRLWPRSWRPGRPRRPRSRGGRAATGHHVARPTRRTSRRPREGSCLPPPCRHAGGRHRHREPKEQQLAGSLSGCVPERRVLNRFFVASESFESVGCRPRSA